ALVVKQRRNRLHGQEVAEGRPGVSISWGDVNRPSEWFFSFLFLAKIEKGLAKFDEETTILRVSLEVLTVTLGGLGRVFFAFALLRSPYRGRVETKPVRPSRRSFPGALRFGGVLLRLPSLLGKEKHFPFDGRKS